MTRPDPSPHPSAADADASQRSGSRVLCPYCGVVQPVTARCASCRGLLDLESRQATQNAMGPWFIRNPGAPYHPGCSWATLKEMVRRGKVSRESVIRGPTTHQFWNMAANTPGVAVLLGECHACHQPAREDEYLCRHCGVVLTPRTDRQHLGLSPIQTVAPGVVQAPIVSAAPVSALHTEPVPAPTTVASLAQHSHHPGAAHASAPSDPHVLDLLAQRRSRNERARVWMQVGAGALALGALIAVGAVLARTAPRETPPATAPATTPQTPVRDWNADIDRAVALAAAGTPNDLASAVRELHGLKENPDASLGATERRRIDDALLDLRARLDDARLRDALDQPAPQAGSPK